jgi:hypothetical protein
MWDLATLLVGQSTCGLYKPMGRRSEARNGPLRAPERLTLRKLPAHCWGQQALQKLLSADEHDLNSLNHLTVHQPAGRTSEERVALGLTLHQRQHVKQALQHLFC